MAISENNKKVEIENDIADMIKELKIKYPGTNQDTQHLIQSLAKKIQTQDNPEKPEIVEQFLKERHGKAT